MSIEYEFTFNHSGEEELSGYLTGLPYFKKYDTENYSYIYQRDDKKYPEAVIEIHEIGIYLNDYLTGVGRELIGLLVEHITGNYGEVTIDERD